MESINDDLSSDNVIQCNKVYWSDIRTADRWKLEKIVKSICVFTARILKHTYEIALYSVGLLFDLHGAGSMKLFLYSNTDFAALEAYH